MKQWTCVAGLAALLAGALVAYAPIRAQGGKVPPV